MPSSEFGKAVQEALRITHTSGRWKREQIESQDGQSTEYLHLPHADWQTPTEYAVRKHRHKMSKTKKVKLLKKTKFPCPHIGALSSL